MSLSRNLSNFKMPYPTNTWRYGGIFSTDEIKSQILILAMDTITSTIFTMGILLSEEKILSSSPNIIHTHKKEILNYFRDYPNPLRDDKYFPIFRNNDWFVERELLIKEKIGFGGIHGQLFCLNSEIESTSEAIMSYYGMMLLEEVMKHKEMKDLGWLLLAIKTASTKAYWHIPSSSNVYPELFKSNN